MFLGDIIDNLVQKLDYYNYQHHIVRNVMLRNQKRILVHIENIVMHHYY